MAGDDGIEGIAQGLEIERSLHEQQLWQIVVGLSRVELIEEPQPLL